MEAVQLLVDDKRIQADLVDRSLKINDVDVDLSGDHDPFQLVRSRCLNETLLRAGRDGSALWLDLPAHGLRLQTVGSHFQSVLRVQVCDASFQSTLTSRARTESTLPPLSPFEFLWRHD